jgi:mannan endo-1,4-beta-mannosidase
MQKKQFVILTFFFFIFLNCLTAQKPGFYVQGRYLYDRCGEKVVLRGVNEMSVFIWNDIVGAGYLPEIRKTGANSVRLVWNTTGSAADLDVLIQNCINNKMIPIIELHDATDTLSKIPMVVDYWVRPDIVQIIKKHEQYLIVNIANEAGNWQVTKEDFIAAYQTAIKRMRAVKIRTPLMIDASNSGINLDILDQTASTLLNSDTEKNILFSVHLYWPIVEGANVDYISAHLQQSVNQGYCLVIGELSQYGAWADVNPAPCSTNGEVDYKSIIQVCQKHEIGWLAWSWGRANNKLKDGTMCPAMDMALNGLFTQLKPGWATEVCLTSPYSIKNTSIVPKSILTGACQVTADPFVKFKAVGSSTILTEMPISVKKGTYSFDFETNIPLTDLNITVSPNSWLKVTSTTKTFTATANTSRVVRTAIITATYRKKPTLKAILKIVQSAL